MIRILPDDIINKIAAGEVIERPASVFKELIENACDAGSTRIIIDIEQSGQKCIRISDNGTGMSPLDARLAIERHATSKLNDIDSLSRLQTLGFRGEALPSIAAVSRFSLLTRSDKAGSEAWKIEVEGTRKMTDAPSVRTAGTTIEVLDLFYNTPARKKFLKKDTTELSQIMRVIEESAIVHPAIAFTVYTGKKELLNLPAGQKFSARLQNIFGETFHEKCIPVHAEIPGFALTGVVSRITGFSASRKEQYFFINRRPVSSRVIVRALYDSYRSQLPDRRHPAAVLCFEIDPALVDINVHPAKREVRITREQELYRLITGCIQRRITMIDSTPVFSFSASHAPGTSPGGRAGGIQDAVESFYTNNAQLISKAFSPARKPHASMTETLLLEPTSFPETSFRILGQFCQLYIIAEAQGELWIIDQHAAEERILFEQFSRHASRGHTRSQKLLVPYHWDVSPEQYTYFCDILGDIQDAGIVIEEFGTNSLLIREIPAYLGEIKNVQAFMQMLYDDLPDISDKALHDILPRREALIRAACRAAVKSRDTLAPVQGDELIQNLKKCKNPFTCPHGRPTLIRLKKNEIDRRFGR